MNAFRGVIQSGPYGLQVIGRAEALRFAPDLPHVVISISEPRAPLARYPDSPHRLGMLRLSFHDASIELPDREMFSTQHARQIIEFVRDQRDGAKLIVCQCEAGISRSAAVAAALSHWLCGDGAIFFHHYSPNRLVYARLLEAVAAAEEG
jgi:predicted protein tyrosine phosphatase